jgi:hypothetical protein
MAVPRALSYLRLTGEHVPLRSGAYVAPMIWHTVIRMNNFQRVGAVSNTHVGKSFEDVALDFFTQQGILLAPRFPVSLGTASKKRMHNFDFGSESPPVLVECKSHKWTEGGNSPSAKLTVWNEAMYYFLLAPSHYRKVFFVLKHARPKGGESLSSYYLRRYGHLVPESVEMWEWDEVYGVVDRLH